MLTDMACFLSLIVRGAAVVRQFQHLIGANHRVSFEKATLSLKTFEKVIFC